MKEINECHKYDYLILPNRALCILTQQTAYVTCTFIHIVNDDAQINANRYSREIIA